MKKVFLAGCAVLFLAAGTAQADCCDMPKLVPAGHAFDVAAKRQFGRGFSRVSVYEDETIKPKIATVEVKDNRYLGLDKDKSYLLCRYRTKPVIRFFSCFAWEGE